ncbi:beta strand repeat-containing protein [Spirosoma spitsbergense]|uniref:beta strand repeat-containing protein n=1 Tax=Spirosoma spitsbergense TaxID=431554 RepID=UPI000378E3B0|nr:FG-GAP-like repeat-containing protein [Spirosoma spitsbergense]
MKHVLRQLPNLTTSESHGIFLFNPKNRQHASRWWFLFLLLTSLSTLSWGQSCFNTSTVSLGYITAPNSDSPTSEATGDFNGDGKLDLAIVNQSVYTVGILLNTGNGTFGPVTTYTAGSQPRSVAVGDFNGDGKPDLAVGNVSSKNVSILLNTGGGSFGAATNFPVGMQPRSIAVGDFNSDGKPDVATGNYASNNVSILLNAGGGDFGGATNFAVGTAPNSLVAGDFNGDGKVDLATANYLSNNVSILLGNGSGSFSSAAPLAVALGPDKIISGDFNGDGRLDLAVLATGTPTSTPTIAILLGNGSGGFGAAPTISLGFNSYSIDAGDFNGDGKTDLVAGGYTTSNVVVFLSNGDGSFGTGTAFATGVYPFVVLAGDFNGDGKLDLAAARSDDGITPANVAILLGKGDGTFGAAGTVTNPRYVAVGDFNGDGRPDIAVANRASNNVSILLANGSGGFGTATNFAVGSGPRSVVVADFNLDGNLDLAVGNYTDNTVTILLGNGSGGFGMAPNVTTGSGPQSVATADFNSDGKPDLAIANYNANTLQIVYGDGHGGFGSTFTASTGANPAFIAIGDFNGNGKPDLAIANSGSGTVTIIPNAGASTTLAVGSTPYSIVTGDFNGDGKLDLATANRGTNNISVLLGNGDGSFGAATNFVTGSDPVAIAIGDFNADGKLDLATANANSNNVSVLLGNGLGSFGAATAFGTGRASFSVAVGDFNADSKQDLIVANLDDNDLSLLLNCTATANTPPTVANVIPNQTGTVGTAFNYTIPANTFTDAETPGSLVLSATGLPAGLSFAGSTISGTPSVSGVSTVTIKATDPGSLSASTSFMLTINPAVMPPASFAIVGVTTVSCTTLSAGERNLTFNPQYAGVNGQPISFSVLNEMLPTTSPGPYSLHVYTDNSAITLKATQTGTAGEASFVYNWLAACTGGGPPPVNQPPVVANAIPNQTGTVGTAFSYMIPANTFTDPNGDMLTLSATGLPAGLSFAGSTISGTPSASGVSTVSITATDPGGLFVSTSFMLTINPAGVMLPFAITGVTTVNCTTLSAGERNLTFNPQYTGVNGQPISFSVMNEMTPTTSPGPYSLHLYTDNPVVTLQAVQSGVTSSFVYNWLTACNGGSPRLAAVVEPTATLQVKVLGNPVYSAVEFDVTGAEARSLHLSLIDGMGRIVNDSHTEQAGAREHYQFDVSTLPAGPLLLRVSTPGQSETVRILKSN